MPCQLRSNGHNWKPCGITTAADPGPKIGAYTFDPAKLNELMFKRNNG